MIFRELIFRNFLVFKGTNRIQFPSPDKHRSSLILVLAPNSGGKTTVIRALEFLIYGRLRRDMPATVEGLVNKAHFAELTPNDVIDSWVEAKVEIGERIATVRRRIAGRRTTSGGKATVVLEQIVHTPNGDAYKVDEGSIQRSLTHLVPESLFDYFYFQGETLAQQLLYGKTGNAIPQGLATLLHEDTWSDASDTVDKVIRKLSSVIQQQDSANADYKRKDVARSRIRDEARQAQLDLKAWQDREALAKSEFDAAEQSIRNLGGGQSDKRVNEELRSKRQQAQAAGSRFSHADTQVSVLIAESRGLPFYRSAFGPAWNQLEEMRRENILPADVSEGFVNRLLSSSRCICGRSLTPPDEFATERLCIEEYRKRTLAVDLNAGLLSLLNRLDSAIPANLLEQSEELNRQLKEALDVRREAIVAQSDLRQAIQDLEDKRTNSSVDAIVAEQSRQRSANEHMRAAASKLKELEVQLRSLDMREKAVKKEMEEIGRHGGAGQSASLFEARELANDLQSMIDKSLELLKQSFHRILQQSVEKYYNPKANDGSTAHIDPTTLLPQIWHNGKMLHVLGGGQGQLLVLAHIISLAELRRDLHAQLDSLGIKSGKLDDQSFFLDSIFAPCDHAYARDVAAFLPGKARQMVVLLAKQQWYDQIRRELEPHVNRAYGMRLHSNNQVRADDEYVFDFKGKRVKLFKRLSAADEAYVVIEEIRS